MFALNGSDLKRDKMSQTQIRVQRNEMMMKNKIRPLKLRRSKMKKRNSRKISKRRKSKSVKNKRNRNKSNLKRKEQMIKNHWLMDIF